jgi:hypothetical protein
MSSILGQSEPQAQPQVFVCPKFGKKIDTSIAQYGYCDGPLDPQKPKGLKNPIN